MNLSDSKKKLALAGVLCGLVAAALAYFGNPANMAFCIACFIRDTAGALKNATEPVKILVTEPHQKMNVEKLAKDRGKKATATETAEGFEIVIE